ncbi:MAG: beta-glucosidase [Sphaerochaetaceae bacterium]|nr:beta-glucosidase [Sphaerochaetaceae bacterium]
MNRRQKEVFQNIMINKHMTLKKKVEIPNKKYNLNVKKLISQMTLDEKIDYISGINEFCIRGIERLNLKEIWTTDATAGVRGWDEKVTVFPSPIAMAATFNRDLVSKVSSEICKETKAVGASILLAPGVNIARVPTCGRNFEYFGEDPYLSGEMAKAYIEAANKEGVVTTVKHFACNNSDYDRHKADSVVDERTLHEIYLPAFKKAVDSGTLGVMTSYNLINGVYASENEYLIETILRKKWKYKGFVISDWTSVYSTVNAIKHGIDLEMPKGIWFSKDKIMDALNNNKINEADIDKKIFNILTVVKKAGLLDDDKQVSTFELHSKAAQDAAYQVAIESITLLKNDTNLLPLDKSEIKKIVIIGKNGDVIPSGGGSSHIIPKVKMVSLEEKLKGENFEVESFNRKWFKDKVKREIVRNSDLVIIKTGFDNVDESEAYDRDYEIDNKEVKTIIEANKLNKNTITIINSGGAFNPNWVDKAQTLLLSYYLGEKESDALFDIIFNKVSPCGKLPFTIAKKFEDYESTKYYYQDYNKFSVKRIRKGQGNPNIRKIKKIEYKEGLLVGYRDFRTNNKEVAFDFGFGLSYATFKYSNLDLIKDGDKILVNFSIENTSKVDAKETAFIFVHAIDSRVFRVEEELKGFEKVELNANGKKSVTIKLNLDAFKYYSEEKHDWVLESCNFEIRVNSSANKIELRERLLIV